MKSYSLALVLVLSLALTSCGWLLFHKMYSATAEIQVKPRVAMSLGAPMTDDSNGSAQIAAEINIMLSADILTQTIQTLNLDHIWAERFKSDHDILTPQEALDHLRKILKIEPIPQTDIIKITASSEVPQEAADIANAVADHYKAMRDQEEAERDKRGVDSLRDQIVQQEKVVDDAKAASGNAPTDTDARRELEQQQALLDALNVRLKQVIADEQLAHSPVRILTRAGAPPE